MGTGHGTAPERPRNTVPVDLTAVMSACGLSGDVEAGVTVTGVASSSTSIVAGDLYVALSGVRHHGAHFASDAVASGATAILTDPEGASHISDVGVPVLVCEDPRVILGSVAAFVYGNSEWALRTFAVTGTNGKTSVVYMVDAVLRALGHRTGVSTTAARIIDGDTSTSDLTTPEADEVQALVARMGERGVDAAVFEVSAHAMTRHRVGGMTFDVAGFTNFSQDHLDDYADMEEYFAAKLPLFTPAWSRVGVVCVDDSWSRRVVDTATIPIVTVGSVTQGGDPREAQWRVTVTDPRPESTAFTLEGPAGERLSTSVDMVGDYSATNAALALVMVHVSGTPWSAIASAFTPERSISARVPGRMEIVSGAEGPVVYVDYGHTAEAFARALAALREVTPGRVIMVFGADGDRDRSKRHMMGRVAATGADVVVVTDYHPRSEDPAAIRAALLAGAVEARSDADIHEVADQREAVRFALRLAQEGDSILYAGPGHETYQEIAGTKVPYNAREDVRAALRDAGWPPLEPLS